MRKKIKSDNNPKILNDFLIYLKDIKNYSIRTILGYELDIQIFLHFILSYIDLDIEYSKITAFSLITVKVEDIYAFLFYLNNEKNNCSSTRARKVASLKQFFKWLYSKYPSNKENPTLNLSKITLHYRLPKYLTLEEAKKMQNIFNNENSQNYIRNNTILILFLNTGMRLSELININIKDINFDSQTIIINGKGNKERTVYLSNYCKNKLIKYLETRKDNLEPLFISSQHKRISKSSIESICKKAYKIMGIEEKKFTVHTLRHTAATIIFKQNRDIVLVKEFLGHSTILSTQTYLHTQNDLVKEAVNKNPLNTYKKGGKYE